MLLVSTQFQKCLDNLTEDTTMQKFSQTLTLPCDNGADALEKLRKLMKRGCTDDGHNTNFNKLSRWNTRKAAEYKEARCNLIVHKCGQILIVGHEGFGNMIERVRDVENYRVQ